MYCIGRYPGGVRAVVTAAIGTRGCCSESCVILTECRDEIRCEVAIFTIGSVRMGKRGGRRRHPGRVQPIVTGVTGHGNSLGRELPQDTVTEDATHVVAADVMAEVTGG